LKREVDYNDSESKAKDILIPLPDAGEQGSKGAEEQGSRGAQAFFPISLSPLLPSSLSCGRGERETGLDWENGILE